MPRKTQLTVGVETFAKIPTSSFTHASGNTMDKDVIMEVVHDRAQVSMNHPKPSDPPPPKAKKNKGEEFKQVSV
jgi:hypothetical protein